MSLQESIRKILKEESNRSRPISRAYYNRNPEYNTLWIEKGDADKFVDSLTIYVPFDRTVREDYVKNYFQFEYAQGKKILFINSRDGY